MENASKALIMAGSVLLAIIVISVLSIFFDNLRQVAQTQENADGEVSAEEFNKQFDVYARNVYGTELCSLANKVISYNKDQILRDTGYQKVELYIHLTKDLNDDYFKAKKGSNSYYTAEEWIEEYEKLKNARDEVGNCKCKIYIDDSTRTLALDIKTLATMKTSEKEELGFKDTESTLKVTIKGKQETMTLGKAIAIYNTYKNDFTKIKELGYEYKKFEYSPATGRVIKMYYEYYEK